MSPTGNPLHGLPGTRDRLASAPPTTVCRLMVATPDVAASVPAASDRVPGAGLADALQIRTAPLHLRAERAGIVRALLRGEADRAAYALFLRNLLPAYEAMEGALERFAASPATRAVVRPEVFRARAIRSDLDALSGPGWEASLAVVPGAAAYAGRIAAIAPGDEALLVAHAYVRYLGDLNGGQILKRVIGRALGLGSDSLAFYDFPRIADLAAFKRLYRAAFDEAGSLLGTIDPLLDEAEAAFRFNIELSEEVSGLTRR